MGEQTATADQAWRDAWQIAWVGACNPLAVTRTLDHHREILGETHPAVVAISGHLAFLHGVKSTSVRIPHDCSPAARGEHTLLPSRHIGEGEPSMCLLGSNIRSIQGSSVVLVFLHGVGLGAEPAVLELIRDNAERLGLTPSDPPAESSYS